MPTIDHTAFRTIIGASLTTTALLEGVKELYKRQKKKKITAESTSNLPCSSCAPKPDYHSQVTENGSPRAGDGTARSSNQSRMSSNPFPKPRSPKSTTSRAYSRHRSSSVTVEPGAFNSSSYQDEIEYLCARLSRYEISSWLPSAFTAFHEYPLNTWSRHPTPSCPPELSPQFHSSLLLLRDRLRCRTPQELALILMQLAECFSGSSVDWEDEVGLEGGRWLSVGDLFWAPGPRGIGHPERFWRDALAANKALPQINPAEIMIGAVVERRGYGREGYAEAQAGKKVGRERVDSGASAGYRREGYVYGPGGEMETRRVESGPAGSERSSELTTESERERSRDRVVRWEN